MATETIIPAIDTVAPAASAAPAAAPAPGFRGSSLPVTAVDPAKHPGREEYAAALLKEKLAAASAAAEQPAEQPAQPADEVAAEAPAEEEGATPQDAPVPATGEVEEDARETAQPAPQAETAEEEIFELDPPAAVTPDALSKLIGENAELGRLLEADPKLKGQLYKTAREAAELRPYRELFPDLEAAQAAQGHAATWMDVRESFLGSTSREGAMNALAKMAELSYERDANGSLVLRDGEPVIGEDFFGFVDHVVGLDLENRAEQVEQRLKAGRYASPEERDRDERMKAALEILRDESAEGEGGREAPPDALQRRQEELERRERALMARERDEKLEERRSFESGLQAEAQKRIGDGIEKILANVEQQGGAISPYLKKLLPKAIGAKLVRKIQANAALQGQMQELQRLPAGDAARQRRLAAIDRAVQQYLPEVAREELREAGVQTMSASNARRSKVEAQARSTQRTEPKGSTGAAGPGAALSSNAAFDHAQAEWQRANPGRPFDKVAREQILPRVIQLMTQR